MTISQKNEILAYIQNHGSITQLEALNDPMIRSMRLGARIYELRKAGHNIETEWIKNGRARYAKYIWKEAA